MIVREEFHVAKWKQPRCEIIVIVYEVIIVVLFFIFGYGRNLITPFLYIIHRLYNIIILFFVLFFKSSFLYANAMVLRIEVL